MKQPVVLDRLNPHQVNWADGRMFAMFTDAREALLFVEMTKRACETLDGEDIGELGQLAFRYFTAHK
jgi:hypothetical protein